MANNCYDICPIGTYPSAVSAVNVCSTCPTECTNCASATVCLACLSRYYLYRSSCVQSCPDTYFINTDTGSCAACSYPCYLCKANGCLTCSTQTTLYLFSLQCVPNCAVPLHPNNATMVCEACVSPCKECTWSNECVSCVSSYYLSGNKCLSSCPVGYYG